MEKERRKERLEVKKPESYIDELIDAKMEQAEVRFAFSKHWIFRERRNQE